MTEIQLLFTDEGNRRALADLLADRHTPVLADQLQDADLYLVDESSYPHYRDALESHKREVQPVFCPVVLVRREQTPVSVTLPNIQSQDQPLLINEVVRAPVGKQELLRTIANLLARREQTETLSSGLHERTAQLEEERTKYQTLVEQSESGIAVTQDGKFVFCNERLSEILGRDQDALQRLPVTEVVTSEYEDLVQTRHEQRIAGNQPPTQYEIAVRTPDDQRKYIDLRASRIEFEGEPAVLVLFRDITDRKQHERELRQFKNAVDHAGHAIIVTDRNGVIQYVNPAFEETTGYSRTEAVGATPRILKSGEHGTEFYKQLWNTILDGKVWNAEIINERKNGERFVALQTIAPIMDAEDNVEGFVGIQDEITDRRIREQQLEVFHRVLRHNLRNKGSTIKGHVNLLQEELDDDVALDRLQTIQDNIQSLLTISEKAQHVRQVIADTTDTKAHQELRTALEYIVESLSSSYPNAQIQVDIDTQDSLQVDTRAIPALQELIENALKHSTASTPEVSITATTNPTTTLTIADNGPGLPEQERQALETGSETPLQHGSGLGLWLAYWLIHYVGGDININSDDTGTEVTVILPGQNKNSP